MRPAFPIVLAAALVIATGPGLRAGDRPSPLEGAEPGQPEAVVGPSGLVLLRITQLMDDAPKHSRKGLRLWIAAVDEGEPLREIETNLLDGEAADQGWIGWTSPPGAYHLVVSAYATGGLPPTIMFDRYRFLVRDSTRALYLGSLTYRCRPATMFKALCPAGSAIVDESAAAHPIGARLGASQVTTLLLRPVNPPRSGPSGTRPADIPCMKADDTLVMAGEGKVVRMIHDFIGQSRDEAIALADEMGFEAEAEINAYGPFAFVIFPVIAMGGATEHMIRGHRLKNKAKCAQRIWDERAENLARAVLNEALGSEGSERSADAKRPQPLALSAMPDRFRNLLALNVHRLVIDSCHPGRGVFPGPRGKRFCLEVAIRARLYGTDLAEPVVDEIYSFVPELRVGHEYKGAASVIPPGYMYETPLKNLPTVKRTYREYCDDGGFDLVQDDLRLVVERMVPRILSLFCVTPAPTG